MKRRDAVKTMGASVLGLPAIDYILRKISTQKEVRVNIYQSRKLTHNIKTKQIETNTKTVDFEGSENGDTLEDIAQVDVAESDPSDIEISETRFTVDAAQRAINVFNNFFNNLNFTLTFNEFDILFERDSPASDLGKQMAYLKHWMQYNNVETQKSKTVNILLLPRIIEDNHGIATTPIIPNISIYDGHGIVWVNPRKSKELPRLIAHEIGHTLGLNHFHGSKIDKNHGSIMYAVDYADQVGFNIYGESLRPVKGKNKLKFNPKITEDSLRI